jgi:hypothetical protein
MTENQQKTKKVSLHDDLIAEGLTIHRQSDSGCNYESKHTLKKLDPIFKKHNFKLVFDRKSMNGIRQVVYENSSFEGGHAVLTVKRNTNTVWYLTTNYSRNLHD